MKPRNRKKCAKVQKDERYIVLPAAVKIRGAEEKDTSLTENTH